MSGEKLRLGGMALRNGLLVHGPAHWAVAIRTADGRMEVASGRKPDLSRGTGSIPGVRGVAKLAEALALLPVVKRRVPEAQLPMQDARTIAAIVGATLAARVIRGVRGGTAATEAAVGLVGVAPALLALRGGDLAAWHGVEHKAIAAYEEGADAADALKEHDRCGSNLVAPLLAGTFAGNVAARRAGLSGPATDAAVALGSMAVAVEIFGWSERHAHTALARALRRPGHELQRTLGTREPTEDQLDVGRAAMAEILRVEGAAG